MATAAATGSYTLADLHWATVKEGVFNILDLFDSLPWFRGSADWTAWRAFLAAVYGLPMTDQEYDLFVRCTGRKEPPKRKVREAWGLCGRRGRKSAIEATIGVYEGAFRDHSAYLAPGETGRILIVSKDKDDAGQVRSFAGAILDDPNLTHLVDGTATTERIPLSNHMEIMIRAAKLTAGRSRTIPCALYDEVAFWPTEESATPDEEIMRGVDPAMANVPQPLTVGMSSLYARRGVLYQRHRDFYGVDGQDEVLVWKADTLTMHDTPEIRAYVSKAWRDDAVAAAAEVGIDGRIDFRADVETFIPEEVLDAVIVPGRHELAPDWDHPRLYFGFCDPSGGSQDSMTLSIAHFENATPKTEHGPAKPAKIVQDALREWRPPFDTGQIVADAAELLKAYRIKNVKGDHYGGNWPRDRFKEHGIVYVVSDRPKREIYRDVLPMLNGHRAELLDSPRMRLQFVTLDRHVARGGADSIDHRRGAHDDLANACAGSLLDADVIGSRRRHPEPEEPAPRTTWDILRQERMKQLESERHGERKTAAQIYRRQRR